MTQKEIIDALKASGVDDVKVSAIANVIMSSAEILATAGCITKDEAHIQLLQVMTLKSLMVHYNVASPAEVLVDIDDAGNINSVYKKPVDDIALHIMGTISTSKLLDDMHKAAMADDIASFNCIRTELFNRPPFDKFDLHVQSVRRGVKNLCDAVTKEPTQEKSCGNPSWHH